jgi:hypothetical protein
MRVDDGPAVLPERGCGQIIQSRNDLSLPLPILQASFPQNGRGESSGISVTRPLISKDVLSACCALAALCLCQVWFGFVAKGTANLSFFQGAASVRQFAALLTDTILLPGGFLLLWRLGSGLRKLPGGEIVVDLGFLVFLAVPANAVRAVLLPLSSKLNLDYWRHLSLHGFQTVLKFSLFGGIVLLAAALLYFHRRLAHIAFRVLVFLFPLFPFILAESSWVVTHPPSDTSQAGNPSAGLRPIDFRAGGLHGQRVVWIIFDKLDYRLAFESATNAHLPEFNKLARQSLHAVKAYPPGGRTAISVPALLAGRLVTGSTPAGVSDLLIRYEGSTSAVRWSTDQTVFDVEREKGWRTGVAGWYFPYSRVFGADVDAWQEQDWRLGLNPNQPFLRLMTDQLRVLVSSKAQSLVGRPLTAVEHRRVVGEVVAESMRKAADPALDLVFVHLPVPHEPFYYDASTGQDAVPPRPVIGYLDHLQLGDHVLGQIRQAMNEAGVAGHTTLLVSSDHWNQEADLIDGKMDHRVPFLVRFPGDSHGLEYSAPFNTILTRRLVTAIMEGEIHSAADAAQWIDSEKGTLVESPYNAN